ncbi:MAG TPA: DEAD/DEAH box helicase, partial [Saprospiraceae bacterium]|nr:DEAD/DEAH box helicase [Saprospiraceae bacterium]
MTFNDLNLSSPLLNALDDIGFSKPTTIQHKAFPVIMSGKDVVGLAQTGTGKTLAYLLPLLRLMKFSKAIPPKILIVVPTRELVMQVVEEVEKLASYMTVRVGGVYGGTNMNTQKNIVLNGLDILVATPGRLMDLALNGYLQLKEVKHLVIDEIDEMLNLGFRTQLHNILDLLPPKRQNLLFSATMTEEVEELIEEFTNGPQKIEAAALGTPLEKIIQSGYKVPNFYTKVNVLSRLLDDDATMSKVLVFVATKKLSDLVYEKLDELYPDQLGIIHSNKS